MNKMAAIFLSLTIILLLVSGCNSGKDELTYRGLIGAYYGESDFTNIKESEILSNLEHLWNEETGHGNAWSGH